MSNKQAYYQDNNYVAIGSSEHAPSAFPAKKKPHETDFNCDSPLSKKNRWNEYGQFSDQWNYTSNAAHRFYPKNPNQQNHEMDYSQDPQYEWFGTNRSEFKNGHHYREDDRLCPPYPPASTIPTQRQQPQIENSGNIKSQKRDKNAQGKGGKSTGGPSISKKPFGSLLPLGMSTVPGSKLATVSAVANAKKSGAKANGKIKLSNPDPKVVPKPPTDDVSFAQKLHADGKPLSEALYPGNRLPTGKFIVRRPTMNDPTEPDAETTSFHEKPSQRRFQMNHPIMRPLPPLHSKTHVAVPFVTLSTASNASESTNGAKPFVSPPSDNLPPTEAPIRVKSEPTTYEEPTNEQLVALFEQNQDKFVEDNFAPPPIEPITSMNSSNGFKSYQPLIDRTMITTLENELLTTQQDVQNKTKIVQNLLLQQFDAQNNLNKAIEKLNSLTKSVYDLKRSNS